MVREMKRNATTGALFLLRRPTLPGLGAWSTAGTTRQTETDGQGNTFNKARWYVYDGLGSVVGEVDPLGDLTSSPKYDVYGAVPR